MHNNFGKDEIVLKKYTDLKLEELYQLLRLRSEVFVVEQNCPYQDLDNKDNKAYHLLIYLEKELVAYARVFSKNITFKEASIGRIITSKKVRSLGYGKIVMEKSIEALYYLYGKQPIRIGAQCYAIPFYEKFGFKQEGEIYLEDGIEHTEMLKE